MAENTVKRNWSVFNGYAMKYSPENYYAVAGSSDYITEQLFNDITKENIFAEPVKRDEIMLLSTERTARTASGGLPEYRVVIVKDGSITPLQGYYWKPDTEKERERIRRANERKLKEAEEKQDSLTRRGYR